MDAIEHFQRSLAGPFAELLAGNWLLVALVTGLALYLVYFFGFRSSDAGVGDDLDLPAGDLGDGGGDGDGGGGD